MRAGGCVGLAIGKVAALECIRLLSWRKVAG